MPVEQNFRFLYPKENEDLNYLYDDAHILDDIQIIIYDTITGEIYAHDYYQSYGGTFRKDMK